MAVSSRFSPDQAKHATSTSPLKGLVSHSKSASHIPQMHGSFEYTIKDWNLIPHSPGEVTLSPPFNISNAKNEQWILQVFPEGKDVHKSGYVTFTLRNLAEHTIRATCNLKMVGKDQCQEFIRETEPAKIFSHNAEWDVDTGLTFAEIARDDSDWLQTDGSLLIIVEMTICGNPEVLVDREVLRDMLTKLEPTENSVPTLANDLLKLLDINNSIVELETGEKIINTSILSENLNMLWKADITLSSEEERIPCHQCILAARSPVFCDKLQSTGTNLKMFMLAGKLDVTKHIHPTVLKAFVYYLYSDHCNVEFLLEDDGSHMTSLLRAASHYDVKGLIALCSQYLITSLSVENAASRLALAHACQGTELMQAATLHFIAMHSAEVTETEDFQNLDADLYRLVVGEMTTSPYSSMAGKLSAEDEGIEREASREGGVDESEEKSTPQVAGLDTGVRHQDEGTNNFNTPLSSSPTDVKCKTASQMLPEVDPQHHHKHADNAPVKLTVDVAGDEPKHE